VKVARISDSRINASGLRGGAGIGPGFSHGIEPTELELLVFSGTVRILCDAAVYRRPIEATTIHVGSASIVITALESPVFGSTVASIDTFDMLIYYVEPAVRYNEPFSGMCAKWLLVGRLLLPEQGLWDFCVSEPKIKFAKCFDMNVTALSGFMVSLPGRGTYDINATRPDFFGFLQPFPGEEHFAVGWAPYVTPAGKFFFPRNLTDAEVPPRPTGRAGAKESPQTGGAVPTEGESQGHRKAERQTIEL
jgi:hypothetical protein